MFRKMRRFKQEITKDEMINILNKQQHGVLAVLGDEGYPYSVPLSFAYENHKIYFHSALTGHKVDAIKNNPKVSFCVIEQDDVVQEEFSTIFKSVIVFGKAKIVTDPNDKRRGLELILHKYSPDFIQSGEEHIEKHTNYCHIIEIEIEHMTGKYGDK